MMFHVGQKIVCVDDDFVGKNPCAQIPQALPKRDAVYTVRNILNERGRDFVRLVEIVNPIMLRREPAFNADRFRPIIERKTETDISIFKKMLQPKREDA